jgi:WD40 repeat protein
VPLLAVSLATAPGCCPCLRILKPSRLLRGAINNVLFFQSHKNFRSSDKKVKIWDLGTRQCTQTIAEHQDQVWAVAYNPSGALLASGGDDKALIVYKP